MIAIHTSESAAPMILHIMTKLESKGDLKFIPSAFRQDHGIDAELKILQKHKERIKNIVCLTVYDIREEVLERERKVNDGKQYTLEEYIKEGIKLKTIERTNATETEGKYFFLTERKMPNSRDKKSLIGYRESTKNFWTQPS